MIKKISWDIWSECNIQDNTRGYNTAPVYSIVHTLNGWEGLMSSKIFIFSCLCGKENWSYPCWIACQTQLDRDVYFGTRLESGRVFSTPQKLAWEWLQNDEWNLNRAELKNTWISVTVGHIQWIRPTVVLLMKYIGKHERYVCRRSYVQNSRSQDYPSPNTNTAFLLTPWICHIFCLLIMAV